MAQLQDKAKRVSFFGTVKVISIVPVNKMLKNELFYGSDDYQRFEMDAFYDLMEQERIERLLMEQAQRIWTRKEQDLSYHGSTSDNWWSTREKDLSGVSWNITTDNGAVIAA